MPIMYCIYMYMFVYVMFVVLQEDCNSQLHRVLQDVRKIPAIAGKPPPLTNELDNLSRECTEKENVSEINISGTSLTPLAVREISPEHAPQSVPFATYSSVEKKGGKKTNSLFMCVIIYA